MSSMLEKSRLLAAAERLERWMRKQSWPLWWSRGRHSNGAFFEALDFAGHPVASSLDPAISGIADGPLALGESRVRVQARQLFSFLLAAKLGWPQSGLQAGLAVSAARFLGACFRADGLAGRRVDIEQGTLLDERSALYDNAFCLLALAHSREALGAAAADAAIRRLLESLRRRFAHLDAQGCRESSPDAALQERDSPASGAANSRTAGPSPGLRRQNPHMHLFEALLALHDQTGSVAARQQAESLLDFISRAFFDFQGSFVREAVEVGIQRADSPLAGSGEVRIGAGSRKDDDDRSASTDISVTEESFEPGHSMEWVWLLGHRARLFGVELHPFALPLYQRAWAAAPVAGQTPLRLPCGAAPSAALSPNMAPGNPGLSDPSCRLWAQAETLKAHLCMVEHGPPDVAAAALRRAAQCAAAIGDRWLSGVCPGGWVDHLDARGKRIARTMPASTGYHLYLAIAELSRVARLPSAQGPRP